MWVQLSVWAVTWQTHLLGFFTVSGVLTLILVVFTIALWGVSLRDSYQHIWSKLNQHLKFISGTWNLHRFFWWGFLWHGSTSCTGLGSCSLLFASPNWWVPSHCPSPGVVVPLVAPCLGAVFFDFWGWTLAHSMATVSMNLHRLWVKVIPVLLPCGPCFPTFTTSLTLLDIPKVSWWNEYTWVLPGVMHTHQLPEVKWPCSW